MTANDPSRQQQAVNHGDVELPRQSNRSNKRPKYRRLRRLRPEGARSFLTWGTCPERLDDFVTLRVLSQFFASGAILATFLLDASSDDRPRCASGDFIVLKLAVRTSASVMARLRRCFRFPPPCKRAGINLAPPLAPNSRDPLKFVLFFSQSAAAGVGHRTADFLARTHLRRALRVAFMRLCAWRAFVPLPADDHMKWFAQKLRSNQAKM